MKQILILTILLAAFNSSAKRPFKENKKPIQSLNNIYVITDVTIVEGLPNKQIGINTGYNFEFGNSLFRVLKQYFKGKIPANLIHSINSIGLYERDNTYILDYLDKNQKIILPLFDSKSENVIIENLISEINPLFDKMYDAGRPTRIHSKYQKNMLEKDFSSIQRLHLKEGDAILLLLASGIKVPTKKTIGKAVATTILTLGLVTAIESSTITFNVVLISKGGELLWAGKSLKTSKSSSDKKLIVQLDKIFFGFPIKLRQNK